MSRKILKRVHKNQSKSPSTTLSNNHLTYSQIFFQISAKFSEVRIRIYLFSCFSILFKSGSLHIVWKFHTVILWYTVLNANYSAPKVQKRNIYFTYEIYLIPGFFSFQISIFFMGFIKKNRFFTEKNRHGIIFFKRKEGRFYPKN